MEKKHILDIAIELETRKEFKNRFIYFMTESICELYPEKAKSISLKHVMDLIEPFIKEHGL